MEDDRVFMSDCRTYTVRIAPAAWGALCGMWRNSGRTETGGILIGHYSEDLRTAIVTRATGPSTDARSGATWFVRGIRGLQELLDKLWGHGQEYYLGEWHSHPDAAPHPSGRDVSQMREIANSDKYRCPEPILIILGGTRKGDPQVGADVFTRAGKRLVLRPLE